MPETGFEPVNPFGWEILSHLRMPFRHSGAEGFYSAGEALCGTAASLGPEAAVPSQIVNEPHRGGRHVLTILRSRWSRSRVS